MKRLPQGIPFFLLASVCSLALAAGCSFVDPDPHTFSSYTSYELEILTSDTIANATFYIPLPVKNGYPMAGSRILDKDSFARYNFTVELTQTPPGRNLTGISPGGDAPGWFLKIGNRQSIPHEDAGVLYSVSIGNMTRLDSPLRFMDTVTPFGNEPVFLPKMDFSPRVPEKTIVSRSRIWVEYDDTAAPQVIPVYAEYSAYPSTTVQIRSSITGSNQWGQYTDAWVGNSYTDYFTWDHSGESHGWQNATGKVLSGEGVYPDYDNPAWQKVLNRTRTKGK